MLYVGCMTVAWRSQLVGSPGNMLVRIPGADKDRAKATGLCLMIYRDRSTMAKYGAYVKTVCRTVHICASPLRLRVCECYPEWEESSSHKIARSLAMAILRGRVCTDGTEHQSPGSSLIHRPFAAHWLILVFVNGNCPAQFHYVCKCHGWSRGY
jgi:hypothetical protein